MKTPEQLLDAICGQGNWSQHNLATLRVRDAEAREAALREAAEVVHDEEELNGPMPQLLWEAMSVRDGAEEVLRATVRATTKSIAKHILALIEKKEGE